jgi:Protein of unknown function (DUF1588)/Protein of unknown function (DUF1592)/Protein of unknown function (DUF1585)/Protein of unknown function (DUF1587)/Protein of unknown function (DUF1595)
VDVMRTILLTSAVIAFAVSAPAVGPDAQQTFLKNYCTSCHSGKSPAAGLSTVEPNLDQWMKISRRVRSSEMPPKGAPTPALVEREAFIKAVEDSLHTQVCATGPVPGVSMIRRLNRDEYTATVRELLDVHMNVGHDLPADGAGGQGFDNAAEVLFLSPVLAEKYMDAAKQSLEFAIRDSRARARIGIVEPGAGLSPVQAAQNILRGFLPRAFRRPVADREMEPFLSLFRASLQAKQTFDASVVYMLRGVLMSPQFLFRVEAPNLSSEPRLVDDYALASRLSYFLWSSMPDEMLFDLAGMGKLHEPAVLQEEIGRMLRSGKSNGFVESFVTQWLGTRELGREFIPDPKIFPNYQGDADLQGDIRFQPTVFFHTMMANNAPVTDLLDSNWTIITKKLLELYKLDKSLLRKENHEQPHRIELPPGSHRGGLLGMSAILAVSSYPYRTSPVLRGKWVLDSILGTPPLPPPPNVPSLEEHQGAQPATMRERLAQHRANPVCAGCHSRIDPIGFALENYDALGQWRTEEAGKPIDNSGELPDGTKFAGPDELRAVLLTKKDLFLRNLTSRMLGYALGRGLTPKDSCSVDAILTDLAANGYKSQSLVESIVMSPPFRYQAGAAVTSTRPQKEKASSQ